ncbi:hypothetical protein [Rhodococcus sp. 06-221-2]|uniref:hypothetical protein n=1 Tax=Rhodococcus sp. 06-221-2 TaxID=2022514 RepID=UPI00117A53F8|nr:hypothetical protein [Rhodococcus sp. 06-221-2]
MTTPGSSRPQGAFTISSNFGQDYDEDTVYEEITGQTRQDLGTAVEGFDDFKLGTYNTAADLANLQDRTQRLESVIGYAYSYSSGGLHTGNQDLFIPCDQPVGPSVGRPEQLRQRPDPRLRTGRDVVRSADLRVHGKLGTHSNGSDAVRRALCGLPVRDVGLGRADPRDQGRLGMDRVVSAKDQHRDRVTGAE